MTLLLLSIVSPGCEAQPARNLERFPILGIEEDNNGIRFRVPTGGCTSKANFKVKLSTSPSKQKGLTLLKTVPDVCKGYFPDGTSIFYNWSELNLRKGEPFDFQNEIDPSATAH